MKRLLALMALTLFLFVPATARAAGPDIVVVMVDDLGAIDERVLERLPNIKALFLDSGLRFDRAYTETPLCCPGRASFLTGLHTFNHGVTRNEATLLDPSRTLFTALDAAGYNTAFVGKYLNRAHLLNDKTPPGYDHVAMMHRQPGMTSSEWVVNGSVTTSGYVDRYTVNESIRWLDAVKDRAAPLALWSSYFAPHAAPGYADKPWYAMVEPRYDDDPRCDGIPNWMPPSYNYALRSNGWPLGRVCRGLLTVDDFVGQARALLGDDVLWVFMSDNGMAYGAHGFSTKGNPFSVRQPLYFAGAGVAPGSTDALVSNIDIGVTLADRAGAAMPWADGVTFGPLLSGGSAGRDWIHEDMPETTGITAPWDEPWWGVRTERWHMFKRPNKSPRLYDLHADPWEQTDVSDQNPDVVKQLRELHWGLVP